MHFTGHVLAEQACPGVSGSKASPAEHTARGFPAAELAQEYRCSPSSPLTHARAVLQRVPTTEAMHFLNHVATVGHMAAVVLPHAHEIARSTALLSHAHSPSPPRMHACARQFCACLRQSTRPAADRCQLGARLLVLRSALPLMDRQPARQSVGSSSAAPKERATCPAGASPYTVVRCQGCRPAAWITACISSGRSSWPCAAPAALQTNHCIAKQPLMAYACNRCVTDACAAMLSGLAR